MTADIQLKLAMHKRAEQCMIKMAIAHAHSILSELICWHLHSCCCGLQFVIGPIRIPGTSVM